MEHELTPSSRVAAALLFPNKTLRYNVTYLLYWVIFPFRHAIVALGYPGRDMPSFATAKPRYSVEDKRWMAFEIAFIIVLQLIIAKIAHGGFIWASVIPVAITSSVVSWYFFTNHGLKPIDDGNDILAATTTVTVPEVCNKLHSNFSYHAEHHLFPNMNPHYYPMVSGLFKKHFPSQYHCIPIWEAWRGILQNAIAATRRETPAASPQRAAQDPQDQATRQPEPV